MRNGFDFEKNGIPVIIQKVDLEWFFFILIIVWILKSMLAIYRFHFSSKYNKCRNTDLDGEFIDRLLLDDD